MQEQPTKYQLRSMVLVNAGTNMRLPSNRITAIDPRGGAAVLGDNGVGKTTTLRILPLFFGHLPSHIVSATDGQEAMAGFILPSDASAIAFEYQRGSDSAADLRLAVIRRSDDPNVPFYRLYRSGFVKELFVDEGRFLDDEDTQKRATALGIQTTRKLSTSEYRAVILRTLASSKERERLRNYSLEYSFGPKPLDNLDRIVAAMVKKHISFNDIVQVAVGLVQQDLGHGTDRTKLTFKQGRGLLERWLRDRKACVDAREQEHNIVELEDDLADHGKAEAQFRARHADVAALSSIRQLEKVALAATVESMDLAREARVQADESKLALLRQAAAEASELSTKARTAHAQAMADEAHFEKEEAEQWERRLLELPTLRAQLGGLKQQLEVAESAHGAVTAKYAKLVSDTQSSTATQRLLREQGKEPLRTRFQDAQDQIGKEESTALAEGAKVAAARREHLAEMLEPLITLKGQWEGRKATAGASAEAHAAAKEAARRLQSHTTATAQVQSVLHRAEKELVASTRAFGDHEGLIRQAKGAAEAAASLLETARSQLTPAVGTLLAALRATEDEGWKRTLAKVLDPALLNRDDLEPAQVEEAGGTVFGWQLNVGAISTPDWADDTRIKEAVSTAEAGLSAAIAHVGRLQAELAQKEARRKQCEQEVAIAEARLGVLTGQMEGLAVALAAADSRVEKEKAAALSQADAEIAQLGSAIQALKRQQSDLVRQEAEDIRNIKSVYSAQRAEAKRLYEQGLKDCNDAIRDLEAALEARLKEIAAQLAEHLSSMGVDSKRLDDLRVEAERTRQAIEARETKESLVARWRNWIAAGGKLQVQTLKLAAQRAAETSGASTKAVSSFEQESEKALNAHDKTATAKRKQLENVVDDIAALSELEGEFDEYLAVGTSIIDAKTSVRELRGRVQEDRGRLSTLASAITRRSSTIRQALTARESAVKDFVEASLSKVAESSDTRRAAELCACYKEIGRQIVNDVNLTLRTLLATIGAFQGAIQAFEREVAGFNRRLQAGLTEVKCFERLSDLRLDLVTNFEGLGFYSKLSRMDTIVRQHKTEAGRDYSVEIPSDETARALGEFLSVLGSDGSLEVNLYSNITLRGEVTDNGKRKAFKRANELENISSEGLTSLVLITLMTALLNTVRGTEPVYVPWVTDEVGKFDPKNFRALMQRLRDNHIDVVTASPELGPAQQEMFAQRYIFEDRGRIREYRPLPATRSGGVVSREAA